MHVVTEKHLKEAAKQYPGAAAQIAAWRAIARDARWRSFIDLQQVFSDADRVGDYVIFNIGRNRYRLVTIIHYSREPEGGPPKATSGFDPSSPISNTKMPPTGTKELSDEQNPCRSG
jgi:mRNA interferase HigB